MPIYAYRCGACGHAKDVLQKLSDAPLTVCPACGAESFSKQVTAAGFQLKGSGWYVTDFRGGSGGAGSASGSAETGSTETSVAGTSAPATGPVASGDAGAASGGTSAAASDSSAPSTSSTGTACGGGCACH